MTEQISKDNIQPAYNFLRQWTCWVGAAVDAVSNYTTRLFRYNWPYHDVLARRAAFDHSVIEKKTVEKVYRINDSGRVLKRSLRPDEYCVRSNGEPFIPCLVVERLKNEAACMKFIGDTTDIPVPKILDIYEENGSYHLWTEFVDGVEMSELTADEQSRVIPKGKHDRDLLKISHHDDLDTDIMKFKVLLLLYRKFDRDSQVVQQGFSPLQVSYISTILRTLNSKCCPKRISFSVTATSRRVTY